MDFHLTKEQLLVRKMYRDFAENEVKPLAAEIDEEERFPMETVEKMAKLGMMGIYFPKQYGGAGADVLSYAMCVEELAKVIMQENPADVEALMNCKLGEETVEKALQEKILVIGDTFVVAHVEAAVMAEDTWSDILWPVFNKLCDPFLVCKEWTGKACAVDSSFLYGFSCCKWIHSSCSHHRNIHKLPYVLHILEIAVLRHVDRRMCPVPGVISSVVAVEHIVSSLFQKLCSLLAFRHISSCFDILFSRKGSFPEALGL